MTENQNAGSPQASYEICLAREREEMALYWTAMLRDKKIKQVWNNHCGESSGSGTNPDGTKYVWWMPWVRDEAGMQAEIKEITDAALAAHAELERRFWERQQYSR